MTVHDALDHPWLREDRSDLDSRIPSSRFDDVRQRIRARYVCQLIFLNKPDNIPFRLDIQIQLSVSAVWLIGVHSERTNLKNSTSTAASGVRF